MNIFNQPMFKMLLASVLVVGVLAMGAYAYLAFKQAQGAYTGELTISVTGEGEAVAVPDIGQFSFSVVAEASNAADAQDQSAEAINEIIAYLEEEEVSESDIKTQNYNLSPQYRYESQECMPGSYCPPGDRVLNGYQVRQTVVVKVRDLDAASAILSGVGERGATDISGLSFTIDDESDLYSEARSEAIADAKANAEKLATELGKTLSRIVGFYEEGPSKMPMYGMGGTMDMMERSMSQGSVQPNLPVGENTVTTYVTITYELK